LKPLPWEKVLLLEIMGIVEAAAIAIGSSIPQSSDTPTKITTAALSPEKCADRARTANYLNANEHAVLALGDLLPGIES
jgi:hypothetical protein